MNFKIFSRAKTKSVLKCGTVNWDTKTIYGITDWFLMQLPNETGITFKIKYKNKYDYFNCKK